VLIAASKQTFKLAESRNAMTTIRRYAAEDAHVIFGTAYDESLGDALRVTVIATGLASTRRIAPTIQVVQQPQVVVQRTGTDNIPVLTQSVAAPAGVGAHAAHGAHGLGASAGHGAAVGGMGAGAMASPVGVGNEFVVPSVWRNNRTQAAAKVDALASNGMDEIEIPAFLRKQAD
jgi:cell division protein FtsZ